MIPFQLRKWLKNDNKVHFNRAVMKTQGVKSMCKHLMEKWYYTTQAKGNPWN